jgi:hypothetical protein
VELPLDSWWYPTAGVPGWACGVSGAASRQLVVPHRWGTRLRVWCKWSCLSTAGGTPPLGYPAGRVVTPASPGRPPREGGAGHTQQSRNIRGFGWEMGSRGRFATPADFPRHDYSPYSHVPERRESLGFLSVVQGPFSVAPVQTLTLRFATFSSLYCAGRLDIAVSVERMEKSGVLVCGAISEGGSLSIAAHRSSRRPRQPSLPLLLRRE